MKNSSNSKLNKNGMMVFTAEKHLVVQEQIERRARELWEVGGCRRGTALNDWVQAECEILEHFILACALPHSVPQSSAGVARSKPETRILKRGRAITAGSPQPTSTLATFP
jgi:Protein of unknown function (DUF2934)